MLYLYNILKVVLIWSNLNRERKKNAKSEVANTKIPFRPKTYFYNILGVVVIWSNLNCERKKMQNQK